MLIGTCFLVMNLETELIGTCFSVMNLENLFVVYRNRADHNI